MLQTMPENMPQAMAIVPKGRIFQFGEWLKHNRRIIGMIQWCVVAFYLVLIAVPAFLPIPDSSAHIWSNAVLFAQFMFWGIWWPFVLLSMVLVGRAWCGLFCPEGKLTEAVSRYGRGHAVPRWITWKGWPFTAFVCTTIYGQMVSVYQYAPPALLILGGSTLAAMIVGWLWGRNKRVWCRYLCPVSGVFGLLAKIAPFHFNVDRAAWNMHHRAPGTRPQALACAPLVAIRTMDSASNCHMCGRCSDYRGAVALEMRAPNHEIVHVAGRHPAPWESVLIICGLMGVATGAFHWSASPYFVSAKVWLSEILADLDMLWMLKPLAPWWILTNYPAQNDMLTLLDGALLLAYIVITAICIASLVAILMMLATRQLGAFSSARFHHLVQGLIPLSACGVFLGLSALTITMLKSEGVVLPYIPHLRLALLAGASLWSLVLIWKITAQYTPHIFARMAAMIAVLPALMIGAGSWLLLFFVW